MANYEYCAFCSRALKGKWWMDIGVKTSRANEFITKFKIHTSCWDNALSLMLGG